MIKIKFKEKEYDFPSSLADITLGQRIDFYTQHGKVLDDDAARIDKITDIFDKELETQAWYLQLAARSLSFYTGISFETVQAQVALTDLLNVYNTAIQNMHFQEANVELQTEYSWNNETWCLAGPDVLPDSHMTFNEFLHSKEITRQMQAIGKSKWDALPSLCAIYLRKPGEAFDESFVLPESDRLKLMQNLPLHIAVAVGFFLSGTLSIYSTIFQFSEKVKQRALIPQPTSSDGGG